MYAIRSYYEPAPGHILGGAEGFILPSAIAVGFLNDFNGFFQLFGALDQVDPAVIEEPLPRPDTVGFFHLLIGAVDQVGISYNFV